MLRRADLLLVSALALFGAFLSLHGSSIPTLRVVLAVLLLLVLPGYSLTAALIGRRGADPAEFVLLSLGLSLSLAVVASLVLDLTPWGLQRESWLLVSLVVVFTASAIAAWRRRGEGVSRNPSGPPPLTVAQGLAVLCVPLFLVPAIVIGLRPLPAKGVSAYTALWLVPARAAGSPAVHLGIKSEEFRPTTYGLQLRIGDQIHLWRGIRLAPTERWVRTIHLPRTLIRQSRDSGVAPIEAILVRSNRPDELYRQVRLWTVPSTSDASG